MIKSLYDVFKHWSKTGSVYLYSDPHFGDADSYKFRSLLNVPDDIMFAKEQGDSRPYELYVEERLKVLDEMQIKNINKRITKNDTIIFLGDIGDIECIKKIKGYKVLIMGNHDKGASNYKKKIYHDTRFIDEFSKDFIPEEHGYQVVDPTPLGNLYNKVTTNGLFDEVYTGPLMISDKILLSHEPIEGLPSYMFNIHGHDHSGAAFKAHILNYFDSDINTSDMIKVALEGLKKANCRYFNTCAEWIGYTPVNLKDIINSGLLSSVPSIHRNYIDNHLRDK